MGSIYEIICWTTGLRYVGQTTQTLIIRLTQHKSKYKSNYKYCSSYLVLEHGNYEIYEIEKVEDDSKLNEREFYHIQHTDCVNIHVYLEDGRTFDMKEYKKEWYEANREKILEEMKEYREANQEKIKEYQKKYRENNKEKNYEKAKEKVTCDCGRIVSKRNLSKHEKSQKHLNWLATQS
jgi:hypothetical protein